MAAYGKAIFPPTLIEVVVEKIVQYLLVLVSCVLALGAPAIHLVRFE